MTTIVFDFAGVPALPKSSWTACGAPGWANLLAHQQAQNTALQRLADGLCAHRDVPLAARVAVADALSSGQDRADHFKAQMEQAAAEAATDAATARGAA